MEFKNLHTRNSEARSPKQKTVIVLGAGRGGTSALAGLLRELGVIMPHAHPLKHEWSPACFYTNGNLDLKSTLHSVKKLNNMHDVWGWKSPRDAFVFDTLQNYIRNPTFVIVYRNLLDTVLSGAKYGGCHWEICFEDYAAVQVQLSRIIMYCPYPVAALAYESLIRDPLPVIKELAAWLQLGVTDEMTSAAESFISSFTGYRAISTDSQSIEFDPEELARDREDAQVDLYSKAIENLERATTALSQDIENARRIVNDLIESVHQLICSHDTLLLPSVPKRIPTEFFYLSDFEFFNALFEKNAIINDAAFVDTMSEINAIPLRAVGNAKQETSLVQPFPSTLNNGLYFRLLKEAYVVTRAKYTETIRIRILFQQYMDKVTSKRDFIKRIIQSVHPEGGKK
jgi:hypothetical protein